MVRKRREGKFLDQPPLISYVPGTLADVMEDTK